jgi:DNA-binding response OmpR family regulator
MPDTRTPPRIVVVEDDAVVAETLTLYLEHAGYSVVTTADGGEGLALARQPGVAVVILDLMIPGLSGQQVCRALRETSRVPILMLTARTSEDDRVAGLEMGADDYVPKPFDPRELLARVKSVLRRTSPAGRAEIGAERVRIGRCVLDVGAHRLVDETGAEVPMSPLEFDLLKAFAEHPNQALSRERILNLNQREWDPFDRSVDLRVMRLRKKVEPDPEHPRFIRTVRNEGYVFFPDGG